MNEYIWPLSKLINTTNMTHRKIMETFFSQTSLFPSLSCIHTKYEPSIDHRSMHAWCEIPYVMYIIVSNTNTTHCINSLCYTWRMANALSYNEKWLESIEICMANGLNDEKEERDKYIASMIQRHFFFRAKVIESLSSLQINMIIIMMIIDVWMKIYDHYQIPIKVTHSRWVKASQLRRYVSSKYTPDQIQFITIHIHISKH